MIRMFIDPGSKRAGWSIWEDKKLVSSGFAECQEGLIHKRIGKITRELREAGDRYKLDEVHIEKLNRRTHVFCLWAAGSAIYAFSHIDIVNDSVAVASWKSYWGLKQQHKGPEVRAVYSKHFGSYDGMPDDQVEAILMGAFYVDYLSKRGNNDSDNSQRKAGSGKDISDRAVKKVRTRGSSHKGSKVRRSSLSVTRSDIRSRRGRATKSKRS